MKKIFIFIALLSMSGCATFQSPRETNIAISTLLDEIQIAINEINTRTKGSSLPPFKNAEITLYTKAEKVEGGGATFLLTAKGEKSSNSTNTITLVLTPNKVRPKGLVGTSGKRLADYVVATVKAVDSKNYLELEKLSIEAGFNVTVGREGGIEIDVASVSLEGKSSSSTSDGHTLKLVFEKKEDS